MCTILIFLFVSSQDIGSKGPYLALDISHNHSGILSTVSTAADKRLNTTGLNRRIAASLDTSGSVKFAEFFWETDRDRVPSAPRTVTVSIAGANVSGVSRVI